MNTITYLVILVIISVSAMAQKSVSHDLNINVNEVALLALHSVGNSELIFEAVQPASAGQQISFNKEQTADVWLNYSSIVSVNQKRKVAATVIGEIPIGLAVKVMASESRGAGKGRLGAPLSWKTLANNSVDVISDIGSCYTGRGVGNGHLLTYKIEMEDNKNTYAQLVQSQTSLQILYTLTDDN